MAKRKNPNRNPRAGGIGFAVSALLFSGIGYTLLHSAGTIIVGVVLGLGIGKLVSIMGSGLDTTTHNKQDVERQRREEEESARLREEEARKQKEAELKRQREEAERRAREEANRVPLTGDAAADAVITKGLEMVETIRKDNAAIPDPVLSGQMESICDKCIQIFRSVSEAPSKAPQVRKFMNYYLPTTLKMLANYRTMQDRGVSVQDMTAARDTTVRGLNMILTACQKQIDHLHKENLLDISTDIDVLEQMLKRDGYTESELTGIRDPIPAEPRTAAEAQMRASSAPVMHFPESRSQEDTAFKAGGYRYQDQ